MASSVVPRSLMASVRPGNTASMLRSTSGTPPSQPADAARGADSPLGCNMMPAWFLSPCPSPRLWLVTVSSISGKKPIAQIFGIKRDSPDSLFTSGLVCVRKHDDGLIYVFLASWHPILEGVVWRALLLHFGHRFQETLVLHLQPALAHFGQAIGLRMKRLIILQAIGLGTEHHAVIGIVSEQMGGVGMRGKKPVERFRASHTRGREPASNIIQLFVCLLVDLLFGNGQHLGEITLYGGFHGPVTLDVHQVPCAQGH